MIIRAETRQCQAVSAVPKIHMTMDVRGPVAAKGGEMDVGKGAAVLHVVLI
jgi:hypothetical protein